jgi:hypothetical protein
MGRRSPLPPDVNALLERERVIPPLPAAQRARAMARAQASLATPMAATTVPPRAAPRTRWPAAAAAALVVGAAVAAAAYEIHARMAAVPAARSAALAPVGQVVPKAFAAPPSAGVVDGPLPAPAPAVETPTVSPAEAARAELRLVRRARVAVARGDFAAALSPIVEHTRRFKNGRLAEEREALRVKALAGLGRTEEARRAAAAFRARFPRSVLLPAVSQMPASGP